MPVVEAVAIRIIIQQSHAVSRPDAAEALHGVLVEAMSDSVVAKANAPGAKASDTSAASSADVCTAPKSAHVATAKTADVASATARFCSGRKQARSKHGRYKHCYQSSHDECPLSLGKSSGIWRF
ncbi:hypothetical protein ACVWXO_004304 [Bradyrhizobium sp. LM2.7]